LSPFFPANTRGHGNTSSTTENRQRIDETDANFCSFFPLSEVQIKAKFKDQTCWLRGKFKLLATRAQAEEDEM
jgi:hypothetical protein